MYKVYDTEEKKWIISECMLSPDGNLYKVIQKSFGKVKLELIHTAFLNNPRYIVYRAIYLTDKDGELIFEGDILRFAEDDILRFAEDDILRSDKGATGVVTYMPELAGYVFLQPKAYKYYPLGEEICKRLKKLGHVADDSNLLMGC